MRILGSSRRTHVVSCQLFNVFETCICILICCFTEFPSSSAQFIQPGLCDGHCQCPPGENVVDCNRQDRLQGVPTNLPSGVTKLYVQEGDFPTPSYLRRANMTGLEQLEDLRIIYCNLQVIEPKTFDDMTRLKHLDLSHNSIFKLEPYTFYGLQLVKLYLQEQHSLPKQGLYISEEAFQGLATSQINLRGNLIQSVNYETFAKVRDLSRLILSDNRIQKIDDGFAKHFDRSSHLLDLTGNPLECSCRLAWIIHRTADWNNILPGLNMTCNYYLDPSHNKGKQVLELAKLSVDQLCPTARIHHIWVNVLQDANRALISCTAVSVPKRYISSGSSLQQSYPAGLLSRTPPGVAWRYVEGRHLREVRRLTSNGKSGSVDDVTYLMPMNATGGFASATVQLNVSLDSQPRKYTCTTWDDKSETEEVVLTLKGPESKPIVKLNNSQGIQIDSDNGAISGSRLSPKDFSDNQAADVIFDRPHYLFQKQFTLLEMAGAVIGTFLATLIFLLIGAQCLRICQRHPVFRLSPSNSSLAVADAKGMYLAGKMMKPEMNGIDSNGTPQKPNGLNQLLNDNNGNNPPGMVHPHQLQYPQLVMSNLNPHGSLSPQLAQMANFNGQYLAAAAAAAAAAAGLPQAPPSSGSGTEDLQSSLALLTSTPLIQSSKLRSMIPSENALSPFLTGTHPRWPIPPGSPYSLAGSHEYDVPRVLDLPTGNMAVSIGSVNRSSFLSGSDQMNFADFGNNADPKVTSTNI